MDILFVSTPWAILNNAAVIIHVQVFVKTYGFNALGYKYKSRIAGSHGNSIFNILRNCQTVFQSDSIVQHFHEKCVGVQLLPTLTSTAV